MSEQNPPETEEEPARIRLGQSSSIQEAQAPRIYGPNCYV
jgi:hypothetical protein